MVWLLNSQGMWKTAKILILSQHTNYYTNDWSKQILTCLLMPCSFFMCKCRAIFYLLWQVNPHGLSFYGKGSACLPSWMGLVNAGWLSCNQKLSCKGNLLFFKAASPNRLPFHLGSLLHGINSLFSHFC